MTSYATYKALPAQERDELGFAKWRETQHIGTHGPGCWKYGRNHYDCALAEIERLRADAARYCEFFTAGLPITFLGLDYYYKPSLDAAIDAAMADKGGAAS